MLTSQFTHRGEPRWWLRGGQELTGEHGDEIVDSSCAVSFANLKHKPMIPAARPAVQPGSGPPRAALPPCGTAMQRLD